MGFFNNFKRGGKLDNAESEACQRVMSSYPTKPAVDQDDQQPANRREPKQWGAGKSFTYASYSRAKESAKESGIAAAGVARSFSAAGVKAREIRYTRLSQLKQLVEIYSGSISNVYKSVCVESGTRVVVKVYHKDKMTAKQHHKLQREIEIQTRIKDCPHVCQLLGVFSTTGEVYLVLESCDGGDLFKALMKAGGRLPEATVCTDIIVPLLRVLESLNKLSILHRDIKPENIFLTADGMMKLGDFGLAIDSTQEIPFCRSGTLDYMAPEVLINPCTRLEEQNATQDQLDVRKIVPYTCKVDVWATGVLAYELAVGRPPFEVEKESQTVALILQSDNIVFDPNLSAEWADFVRTALIKQPHKRPPATRLLEHPWIVKHMAQVVYGEKPRPNLEALLEPIPIYRKLLAPQAEDHAATAPPGSVSKVQYAPATVVKEGKTQASELQKLREEFGGNTAALAPANLEISRVSKAGLSFSVPQEMYENISVQRLSAEEKGDTGAAMGMRSRLQLYMSRQRLDPHPLGAPS